MADLQVGEISVHVVGGLRHYHGLVLRATKDPRDHGCVGCGSGTWSEALIIPIPPLISQS